MASSVMTDGENWSTLFTKVIDFTFIYKDKQNILQMPKIYMNAKKFTWMPKIANVAEILPISDEWFLRRHRQK